MWAARTPGVLHVQRRAAQRLRLSLLPFLPPCADEPTFLQSRHSLEVPAPAAEPPPVVVLMPDDEVRSRCALRRAALPLVEVCLQPACDACRPHRLCTWRGPGGCSAAALARSPATRPTKPGPPPCCPSQVEIGVTEQQKQAGRSQRDAAAPGGLPGPAAPFAHPPAFWVVDADQQHSQGSDSPRSEGYQQGRRWQDGQAVPLLHRPAPRAGMQRRAKAAPSDSFVYMI